MCECEWLFVFQLWPCDKLATYPVTIGIGSIILYYPNYCVHPTFFFKVKGQVSMGNSLFVINNKERSWNHSGDCQSQALNRLLNEPVQFINANVDVSQLHSPPHTSRAIPAQPLSQLDITETFSGCCSPSVCGTLKVSCYD